MPSKRGLALNVLTFLGVAILARDWYEVVQRKRYTKMMDLKTKPRDALAESEGTEEEKMAS